MVIVRVSLVHDILSSSSQVQRSLSVLVIWIQSPTPQTTVNEESANPKHDGETMGIDRVRGENYAQCNPDTRNCHLCDLSEKCIMFTLFKAIEYGKVNNQKEWKRNEKS